MCQVRCSQSLRSGKYAAAVLASQKGNNVDADAANDDKGSVKLPAYKPYNSKELLLPPMDYTETAGAVFEYGARGRFARWAPLARCVYLKRGVSRLQICKTESKSVKIASYKLSSTSSSIRGCKRKQQLIIFQYYNTYISVY